ncbi:hypothetical protein TCON_2097 [Astathelohania contejeani]|uniref:Uncharacterized protein n=1 Tax=Astathelohania contejeani TaxID=164912 RepID=A0ABQ7HWX9_9MICR|nr:hypothetical protein TCON_2097 [Thelohania contejeani]
MKVAAEYKIQIAKQKLSILSFTTAQNTRVLKAQYKPTNKILRLESTLPTANISATKQLTMGNHAIRVAVGALPQTLQFIGRISHQDKCVTFYEVERVYHFDTHFSYIEPRKTTEKRVGYLYKRSESKEEMEHRRKNWNYLLKKAEQEEYKTMEYREGSELSTMDIKSISENTNEPIIDNDEIKKDIRESIRRAKVVNIKELVHLFGNEDIVVRILQEMTIQIRGRFILKNLFYEKHLHSIRSALLDAFRESDAISSDNPLCINKFLVEELAIKEKGKYYLKGYDGGMVVEDIVPDLKKKVTQILGRYGICSSLRLANELGVDETELDPLLEGPGLIRVSNGSYVLLEGEHQDIRKAIIDLLKENKTVRRNEVFKCVHDKTGKELSLPIFNKIMREFCVSKGSTWIIKND